MTVRGALATILVALGVFGCGDTGQAADGGAAGVVRTRGDHQVHFPIATGAHAAVDCNDCHGGFASFTEFTCVSCHDHAPEVLDPVHAAVADYAWESASCLACHPSGEADGLSREAHAPHFPITADTSHGPVACGDCHLSSDRTDPAGFGCIDCHDHGEAAMAATHQGPPERAGVGDLYAFERTSCLQCHAQDVVVTRAAHPGGLREGANVAQGDHAEEVTCSGCHLDRSFAGFTCAPCHAPGGEEEEKTADCAAARGRPCADDELYQYYYR